MPVTDVVIFHNPDCGTSRNVVRLVERPIVVTAKGTALCRPSEKVLDLLDRLPSGPFAKEDGEPVIDADGKRV